MSKLGIIQSRGIGDIVIALPIAKEYADQGNEIYWPICEDFVSHFKDTAPWVNWLPVPVLLMVHRSLIVEGSIQPSPLL